ncbi:MAG: MFS transporter [Candidatus Helarchaeota archaeon]
MEKYDLKNKISYGIGNAGDQIAYQAFTLLIFIFYFSIVIKDATLITIGFIIWSVWNAINDPILGWISDRTKKEKIGRRKFWIIVAAIPASIIMVLLFTPPLAFGISDIFLNWLYFLIIIILFDLLYTMFSLNMTAAFPEMYMEQLDRNQASLIRRVLTIVGLIIAFVLPVLIIGDTEDPANFYNGNYFLSGITIGVIVGISLLIVIKWGIKERKEFVKDPVENPGFFESLKITLKNKSYQVLVAGNLCNWYIYGLIPTIILLFGEHVLGFSEDIFSSLLLLMAFIAAAGFMPLWKKYGDRHGNQKAITLSFTLWGIGFIPFLFLPTSMISYYISIPIMIFIGVGISGSIFLVDLLISDVIDEDEVNTGIRREGAFYGVNALIIRLSTIFVFISILIIFNGTGWGKYVPRPGEDVILGLKILMSVFPATAAFIGAFFFNKFPLKGKRLEEVKKKLEVLHTKKSEKIV